MKLCTSMPWQAQPRVYLSPLVFYLNFPCFLVQCSFCVYTIQCFYLQSNWKHSRPFSIFDLRKNHGRIYQPQLHLPEFLDLQEFNLLFPVCHLPLAWNYLIVHPYSVSFMVRPDSSRLASLYSILIFLREYVFINGAYFLFLSGCYDIQAYIHHARI